MSISSSKAKLVELLGARAHSSSLDDKMVFAGLEFDSREVRGGELFVALAGEKQHGHAFVEQALARGAALVLVEDDEFLRSCSHVERVVRVDHTLNAFWKLASWWRRELKTPLVAVTGSVGKTTVKEMLASILMQVGRGAYSQKSFNNHVGVPYSLCRISREHCWAVIEIGMNHAGEIRQLVGIAEPEVAVINNIAPAHIEHLGSIEAITRAKLEIREGLRVGGSLVLNGDQELLKHLAEPACNQQCTYRYFGTGIEAESRVISIQSFGLDGIQFELILRGESRVVRMGVLGKQNALNAACAALSAVSLLPHTTLEQIGRALEAFRAPLMRLRVIDHGEHGKIVDDSYNANPASMAAFLDLAADIGVGKKVGLILGEMRELGAFAEQYHREIGTRVAALRPHFVIGVGTFAKWYLESAKTVGIPTIYVDDVESAGQALTSLDFDILMLKGSRAIRLDAIKVASSFR